jgi:hypothetical protein
MGVDNRMTALILKYTPHLVILCLMALAVTQRQRKH